MRLTVLIKGAGEMASGVAVCLHSVGFRVVMTEIPMPLAVRRSVAFSEAVYDGQARVEDVTARRAATTLEAIQLVDAGFVAVLVDPECQFGSALNPAAIIDATMAKKQKGIWPSKAPMMIALGPGFHAGRHVDAVIETNRGHHLGRIIWDGEAEPDTGRPAPVAGYGEERVLRAPCAGRICWKRDIGDILCADEIVAEVGPMPITAPFDGVLRGAIRPDIAVQAGWKVGDVDPRLVPEYCYTISDKARAIAGSTLQALLILLRRRGFSVTDLELRGDPSQTPSFSGAV